MTRILTALLAALLAITVTRGTPVEPTDKDAVHTADFAVELLKAQQTEGQNTLISPLSILAALGMTANGAAGETLAQMEEVLGFEVDRLNALILSLLPQNDQLRAANGLWYREGLTPMPAFLAACAGYYRAEANSAPMDASTREAVNAYIEKHTDGMIRDMLDESFPDPAAVMLLVNALSFEAEWEVKYTDAANIRTGEFTLADGGTVTAEYMYGKENLYLEDKQATGFIKPYAGGKYAFAAILPNEGIALSDYIAALDGEALHALISGAKETAVHTALPKFSHDYTVELSGTLMAMGMENAFGQEADFSRLIKEAEDVHISRVLHNTHIEVGEAGTRAAAATVVEMRKNAALLGETVQLTRPFLYMIIDLDTDMPVFIGTVANPT